jgi:lysozyme family protein
VADPRIAWQFTALQEDSTLSGKVVSDPTSQHPEAVSRFGLNSAFFPALEEQGYFGDMPKEQAFEIAGEVFASAYFARVGGNEIQDQAIATKLADLGFNCGVGEAVKMSQRAVNSLQNTIIPAVAIDGIAGPNTIDAINKSNPSDLLAAIKSYAVDYYKAVSFRENRPDSILQAWLKRAAA